MMRSFIFFLAMAALFSISCSNSDKFNANSKPKLELLGIDCESSESYIYAHANLSIGEDSEYYYYYWIIDGEHFYGLDARKKISYGKHFLKFVLIDSFGDTLSDNCDDVRVNEPLKITLLSPVQSYEAEKTDTIEFQYKISGIDTWEEEPETVVYISTDKKEWIQLEDNFWVPPLNNKIYFWKIKASFTKQDSTFSEEREICIKK